MRQFIRRANHFYRNPWSAKDVKRHNKACAKRKACRLKWPKIANAVLRDSGDDGKAIRIANWQVKRMGLNKRRRWRRLRRRNPIIPVYLTAFGDGEPRLVDVPDGTPEEALLDEAFRLGQNDFQPQAAPSVSVGDVIRLPDGSLHRVMTTGFKRLPDDYNPLTLLGMDAIKEGYGWGRRNYRRRHRRRTRRNPDYLPARCDSCEVLVVNNLATHELGCPKSWIDPVTNIPYNKECSWCGADFIPETKYQECCDVSCNEAFNG